MCSASARRPGAPMSSGRPLPPPALTAHAGPLQSARGAQPREMVQMLEHGVLLRATGEGLIVHMSLVQVLVWKSR